MEILLTQKWSSGKFKDGLKILSNETKGLKKTKTYFDSDVVFYDTQKDIEIKSNRVEYDKNLEIIISKDKTFININNKFNILSENLISDLKILSN